MPTLVITTRAGATHTLDARPGISVMETLRAAGIDEIAAICGGQCACATCHVKVAAPFLPKLPAMSDDEQELLSGLEHFDGTSRLSCQIVYTAELDGLRVTVAPEE